MKGAIFDMDGVLFDTESVWQKYWFEKASEMGITLPEQFKKDVCGTGEDRMVQVVNHYYHIENGLDVILDVYGRMKAHLERELPGKEGVEEILQSLKALGYKIAIASSADAATITRNCERSGILSYFDAITSGTEVQHGKPSPDIFCLAAEKLGLPNEECYVFEDAFNGVRAGHASHSKVIMVVDQVEPDEEIEHLCTLVAHSLLEAKDYIEKQQ
mgnify:FL=1